MALDYNYIGDGYIKDKPPKCGKEISKDSFIIGEKDPLDIDGKIISKIYINNNYYILYDVENTRKEDCLRIWEIPSGSEKSQTNATHCKEPHTQNNKGNSNESILPVYYHIKAELSRVKGYPNFNYLKYKAIELFSEEQNLSNSHIINLFSEKISAEIKYQTRNKQTYILTGLLFSLFMLLCVFIISNSSYPLLQKNINNLCIFNAAAMGTIGGYFSILRKINDFFLIGESARCSAVLLALSRLLISAIAGIVSFLLIRAGLFGLSVDTTKTEQILWPILAATKGIDIKTLSLMLIAAFAAGFSESLIPQFMQNFENKGVNQPKSKNG